MDPRNKWWVLLAIGVGTFMSALDGSVVNAILPVIRGAFGAEVATIQWVVTVYLLVVSGLLLSFGRLGDLRGHKTVYVSGFGLFIAASALCGLAPSAAWLIAGRGLQAVGAAMLFSNAPAILTRNFPPEQRGQALGLQATMTYLGLTVGPSLGGWLAESVSWRAVFYLNVPVCGLAVLLSLKFIPPERPGENVERFDLGGAALFLSGLVLLLFGLNRGHDWGWGSPALLSLLSVALLLLTIFVVVEARVRAPMLDLSLFRSWVFSASTISAVMNYICVFSIVFLMPFYLIGGRGLSPGQAGLLLTAQPLVMALVAPLSGTLSDRWDTRPPAVLGMAVLSLGLVLLSHLDGATPLPHVAGTLLVTGFGTGVFISPNNSALMGAAPRHRQGIAAGVLATARNVGMVLGVGIAGAIFTTLAPTGSAPDALYHAVHVAFLTTAACGAAGAVTSALRGA